MIPLNSATSRAFYCLKYALIFCWISAMPRSVLLSFLFNFKVRRYKVSGSTSASSAIGPEPF